MKESLLCMLLLSSAVYAEMNELNEDEMQEATGQAGLTLSAKADFEAGTRISYTNLDADYLDGQDYWLVINNITGSVEVKGMKLDLVNDFGPAGTAGALQWTMPEEIVFDKFKTDGIYMSDSKQVNANSRFVMAVEIDGTLQFPAETKMSVFATQ